jgi:hypothetical protein
MRSSSSRSSRSRRLASARAGRSSAPIRLLGLLLDRLGGGAVAVPGVLAGPDGVATQAPHLVVAPPEHAVLLALRVVDQRHLVRQVEEAVVDELIAIRQEHAEAGVRVVPADHALALVAGVHLLVDVLPGRVGERQLGAFLVGVERVDRGLDVEVRPAVVVQHLADQDPADLARGVLGAALDRAVERRLGDEHRELVLDPGSRRLAERGGVDRSYVE